MLNTLTDSEQIGTSMFTCPFKNIWVNCLTLIKTSLLVCTYFFFFTAQQMVSEPMRRGTSLPLIQLVEETKARAELPKDRPDSSTKNFLSFFIASFSYCYIVVIFYWISTEVQSQSLSLIQAEPAELHFSGFQLQKEYTKTVVSSNAVFDAPS